MKCAQNISSKILCPNKNKKAHKGSHTRTHSKTLKQSHTKAIKQYK